MAKKKNPTKQLWNRAYQLKRERIERKKKNKKGKCLTRQLKEGEDKEKREGKGGKKYNWTSKKEKKINDEGKDLTD